MSQKSEVVNFSFPFAQPWIVPWWSHPFKFQQTQYDFLTTSRNGAGCLKIATRLDLISGDTILILFLPPGAA